MLDVFTPIGPGYHRQPMAGRVFSCDVFRWPLWRLPGKNGMEKFRGDGHEARRILEELKNDIFAIIWENV